MLEKTLRCDDLNLCFSKQRRSRENMTLVLAPLFSLPSWRSETTTEDLLKAARGKMQRDRSVLCFSRRVSRKAREHAIMALPKSLSESSAKSVMTLQSNRLLA